MGCASVEVSYVPDLSALLDVLRERYGAEKVRHLEDDQVIVAHNQKTRKGNIVFSSGDEIAFLPPVTGG